MKTTIIPIGNSKGIRIPKPLLQESGLGSDVELIVKKGEIRIIASTPPQGQTNQEAMLSETALAKDWSRKEEVEAWREL